MKAAIHSVEVLCQKNDLTTTQCSNFVAECMFGNAYCVLFKWEQANIESIPDTTDSKNANKSNGNVHIAWECARKKTL